MVCEIAVLLSFIFSFFFGDFDFRLSHVEVRFIFGFLVTVSLSLIQS